MLKEVTKLEIKHTEQELELLITPQYEPVMIDEQEVLSLSNVYDIDQTGYKAGGIYTPLSVQKPIGKMVFDDNHNWQYIGMEILEEKDRTEIAEFIKAFESAVPVHEIEYDNQFSFYLQLETKLEYCIIKIKGDRYEVWMKGVHAADIRPANDSTWEQTWGEPLPRHSIKEIGDRIDLQTM